MEKSHAFTSVGCTRGEVHVLYDQRPGKKIGRIFESAGLQAIEQTKSLLRIRDPLGFHLMDLQQKPKSFRHVFLVLDDEHGQPSHDLSYTERKALSSNTTHRTLLGYPPVGWGDRVGRSLTPSLRREYDARP